VADVAALQKHSCPACGAQAVWDPGRQKLLCAFCGTESPYQLDRTTGAVEESDLAKALREIPDEARGFGADRRTVQCQSCKAVMVFEAQRVGQNCEFCGSPSLIDYQEIKAPIRPWGILPFAQPESKVRESIRDWLKSRWFAPGDLKRKALVDRVKSLYIPFWTFDARVHCPWEAESGKYYYVQEPVRDRSGRVHMRSVQKVRWSPASGIVEHFFDDEPVPGTRGIDRGLLAQITPFPAEQLVRYDRGFLSGHVVEHYQVVLLDAARASRDSMTRQLEQLCAAQVPGDTQRNLVIHPQWSGETFKHVLVPVWLLTYGFRGKVFQMVVNGATGKMAGQYPKSLWKITALVLAIAVAAAVVALLQQ
jgi:hypothetical protein